jgi:hypothetical protein
VTLIFRAKASINRFRTKPSEFKAKLQDMFVAYFKAEHQNLPESRAAICRRFQMTPALFSRKLLELSEAEKDEYTAAALAQIVEEGRTATPKLVALAAGSAAGTAGTMAALESEGLHNEISARVRTSAMDNMNNSHRGDDFWRTALPSTPSTAAPTPTASATRSPDLTAAATDAAVASHSNGAGKGSSSSAPAPPSFAATHGRARKVANAQGAR